MRGSPPLPRKRRFDVIVVGAGPAGSTMAWALGRQGIDVALLERAAFPREKVCGDYIEPGGLRLLARMGVLPEIEREPRLRINKNRVYFGPKLVYRGAIHYYEGADDDIDYGLIVPRREFDALLLSAAVDAGAVHFPQTEARTVTRAGDLVYVGALAGERELSLRAPIVVGADGVESLVARSVGLRRTNRRHIGVSQRAYVEGLDIDGGEAAVWFDEDIVPGYGWMFPMPGGIANVGVGLSSETSHRFDIPVQAAFRTAVERLRIRHPGCTKARLISRPIGGLVKTYGGIDRNHFDGGLLIGDAGSFVDPMTGEGITQGMESAMLALPTIMDALERRRFEAEDLAGFEHAFRGYFDPAMNYLELVVALVGNRHMSEFWLSASGHGFEEASKDPSFAAISGSIFGGPALRPMMATAQVWSRVFSRLATGAGVNGRDRGFAGGLTDDLHSLRRCWDKSRTENPEWHAGWTRDVLASMWRLQSTIWTRPNPRPDGVFRFIGLEPAPKPETEPAAVPWASPDVQALVLQGVSALFEASRALLGSPAPAPPDLDASPRRRWRIKD